MKFLARHIIVGAELPIYEVVDAENLAEATKSLAYKIKSATVLRVSYDDVRGVVVINSGTGAPNDGAILTNWPEGEPMQGNTDEATVSA